jgi:hypothetical protein
MMIVTSRKIKSRREKAVKKETFNFGTIKSRREKAVKKEGERNKQKS